MSLLIPKYSAYFRYRLSRRTSLPASSSRHSASRLRFIAVMFLFTLVSACTHHAKKPSLMIATAANMQRPMDSLTKGFTDLTGLTCNKTVSSSGNHTAQITAGAPYDVFVSADMKYPETLYQTGHTLGPPKIYGYGQTVLWVKQGGLEPSFESLTSKSIRRIVVPNPKNAPYGRSAIQALKSSGYYDQIKDKLIYAQSVAHANHFMVSGAVDAGFTAISAVMDNPLFDKGRFVVLDATENPPIAQGIVVIRRPQSDSSSAQAFVDFVLSEEGRRILHQFGYTTDP